MPLAWSGQSWSGEITWRPCSRQRSPLLVICLFYVLGLVLLPALLVGATAALCRWSGKLKASTLEVATRFSFTLVPLAFSMWLAHYSYHFLAGGGAVTPALQRFAGDLGFGFLGEPKWALACCRPVAEWLPRLEILSLDLGLLLSLYSGYQIALTQSRAGIPGREGAGALGGAPGTSVRDRSLDHSPTHADAWHSIGGGIRMRPIIGTATLGWLLFGTWTARCEGRRRLATLCRDKGGLSDHRFRRTYTVPGRFSRYQCVRSGCRDRQSRDAVARDRPDDQVRERSLWRYPATSEAATNKLFLAAQFELPEAGRWNMQVEVDASHGAAVIGGEIEAAEPLPRWAEMLPWIAWPAPGNRTLWHSSNLKATGTRKGSVCCLTVALTAAWRPEGVIPYAAMSETSSNCWKTITPAGK